MKQQLTNFQKICNEMRQKELTTAYVNYTSSLHGTKYHAFIDLRTFLSLNKEVEDSEEKGECENTEHTML